MNKKSNQMVWHSVFPDLNISNDNNYINFMVRGCVKRPGSQMVRQLPNKQWSFPDFRVQFPARARIIPCKNKK